MHHLRLKNHCILLFCLFSQFIYGQDKSIRIDSVLNALYAEGKINGNVLVAEKGTIIYNKSFGLADEETKRKLDENFIFELASVSKQFTAMAIVMLAEKGKLHFDDKLSNYIPELAFYDKVTLRNLLNHTSGISDYMVLQDSFFDKSRIATNQDIVKVMSKHKPALQFEPGTKWAYSNRGYDLLAVIVERVSGMTFGDYLQKAIFKPLKMDHTFVYSRRLAPRKMDNYAYGYVYSNRQGKYVLPDGEENSNFVVWLDGVVGASAVNSTVMDLFKWDRALYTNKLVSAKSMKAIFSAAEVPGTVLERYGFGWFLEDFAELGPIVNHSGGWPGYKTFIDRHIGKDKTIIVLMNHDDALIPLQALRRILANKPFFDTKSAKSIPENVMSQYLGAYRVGNVFSNIVKQDDGYYLYQEGAYYKMYFSTELDFFNVEFPSEKQFVKNNAGIVTGYRRFYFGTDLPMAEKIAQVDTIHNDANFFNVAGWHFLERKQFDEASRYLERGLALYPNDLLLQCNLAHSYLFKNDYAMALKMYEIHLGETIQPGFLWADMIRQDFAHFKSLNFDPKLMDQVSAALKL